MKRLSPFRIQLGLPRITRADRLARALADGAWHSTNELVHVVGHTFAVAKFTLVHKNHVRIERQRYPDKPRQWQYRLVKAAPSTVPPHRASPSRNERRRKQRRTQRKMANTTR